MKIHDNLCEKSEMQKKKRKDKNLDEDLFKCSIMGISNKTK